MEIFKLHQHCGKKKERKGLRVELNGAWKSGIGHIVQSSHVLNKFSPSPASRKAVASCRFCSNQQPIVSPQTSWRVLIAGRIVWRPFFGFGNISIQGKKQDCSGKWSVSFRAECHWNASQINRNSVPHRTCKVVQGFHSNYWRLVCWQPQLERQKWTSPFQETRAWTCRATPAAESLISNPQEGALSEPLQGPDSNRVQEWQVFCSFDGEFFCSVVVDHFWHTVERRAVLAQNVFLFGFCQLHVHKALVAPAERKTTTREWVYLQLLKCNVMLMPIPTGQKTITKKNTRWESSGREY